MSHFIVGAVFFMLGGIFGVGIMCLLIAGKQADENIQKYQKGCAKRIVPNVNNGLYGTKIRV